ncbi:MAG: hypothetical protein FWD04_07320 [Conexibacteraceae bacterium]|nr:hypothetical protein [Conexibacteraceae bacterium]
MSADASGQTRVTWRPLRGSGPGDGGAFDLGPCVVIHVDEIPERFDRGSFLSRAGDSVRKRLDPKPPPWEEHIGVVDHRAAERIASEHGVQLEIVGG